MNIDINVLIERERERCHMLIHIYVDLDATNMHELQILCLMKGIDGFSSPSCMGMLTKRKTLGWNLA